MEIKFEDIVLWIIILLVLGLAVWIIFGSPTDTASIIALAIFLAGSEILIWKTLFKDNEKVCIKFEKLDKKTAVSFEKIKNSIDIKFMEINNNLKDIKSVIRK